MRSLGASPLPEGRVLCAYAAVSACHRILIHVHTIVRKRRHQQTNASEMARDQPRRVQPVLLLCFVLLLMVADASAEFCQIKLLRQLSTANCTQGATFDCTDASAMWTSDGCAGLFDCNYVDNIDCDSRQSASRKTCACGAPGPAPAPTPPPSPSNRTHIPKPTMPQRNAMAFELSMFVHYSINTYTSELDPTKFAPNPATLNVSQWVATAKAMGARVAALTSKHEAGFCLWPSKFSNFTIAHSPTVGHRDLVKEFVDECRKQGVKPGLYFTTTDTFNRYNPSKAAIQTAQMQELTTLYGDDIAYFWFDHHAGTPEWYAIDAIVREHQPQCAMLGPDSWLTGQESGYASYPMWHGVDTTDNTTHGRPVPADAAHGNPHGTWFKVWESDCSNYEGCHPWFFGGDSPQPLALMMDHWEATYGRGQNYILNLPPSKDGVITPRMAASAAAFGKERHRRYGPGSSDPSAKSECEIARTSGRLGGYDASNASILVLHLGSSPKTFDRVFLSEDVANDGQLVGQYVVEACIAQIVEYCRWHTLVSNTTQAGGQTIGTHHVDIVNATSANFVRLRLQWVLDGPTKPLISFRVLDTATKEHI